MRINNLYQFEGVSAAKRGVPVHLTTTDSAQHIRETVQSEVAGLRVGYIDPNQEV